MWKRAFLVKLAVSHLAKKFRSFTESTRTFPKNPTHIWYYVSVTYNLILFFHQCVTSKVVFAFHTLHFLHFSTLPCVLYDWPSHLSNFTYQTDNIWRIVKATQLLFMYFFLRLVPFFEVQLISLTSYSDKFSVYWPMCSALKIWYQFISIQNDLLNCNSEQVSLHVLQTEWRKIN